MQPLTSDESRVLGCLIEKEATTPAAYPLTANALRNACNQTTSRDPVMTMTDLEVERALASLRERGLTRTVHSTSNRAAKYRHVAPDVLGLDPPELAIVGVLMLRRAQTVGELKARTERQHSFGSTDEVLRVLEALTARDVSVVTELERRPGQKDPRWIEVLSDRSEPPNGDASSAPARQAVEPPADDVYGESTAEFYDLLAAAHWESFGLQLLDLLDDVDPGLGPVLDIGVGTGVGLPYLSAAVPGASIHAIEPSRAMRTALHTRLALDDELRRITTVEPRPWSSAEPPARPCAIVVSAVLGHFDDAERDRLWRYIRDALPAGAPAAIEVLPPRRPIDIPKQRYREMVVGEHTYEGWQEGHPLDARRMSWTMTYRVLRGDQVLAEDTATGTWRCDSVDDLRAEVAPHGLTLTEHDDCVVVRR